MTVQKVPGEGRRKLGFEVLAWGESADVFRLPDVRPDGSSVVRVERRISGRPFRKTEAGGVDVRDVYRFYYAMRLSNLLYPEHVIEVTGVEPYRRVKGELVPAPPRYFSKYYPLPEESSEEINAIKEEIRKAHRQGFTRDKSGPRFLEVRARVDAFDERMRGRYPELAPTAKKVETAGFRVPHPEVNFTVHEGKIMFYEVEFNNKLNVEDLLSAISRKAVEKAGEMHRPDARRLFVGVLENFCGLYAHSYQRDASMVHKFVSGVNPLITGFSGRGVIESKRLGELLTVYESILRAGDEARTEQLLQQLRALGKSEGKK